MADIISEGEYEWARQADTLLKCNKTSTAAVGTKRRR